MKVATKLRTIDVKKYFGEISGLKVSITEKLVLLMLCC